MTETEQMYADAIEGLSKENTRLRQDNEQMKSIQGMLVKVANNLDNEVKSIRKELDRSNLVHSIREGYLLRSFDEASCTIDRLNYQISSSEDKVIALTNALKSVYNIIWTIPGAEELTVEVKQALEV